MTRAVSALILAGATGLAGCVSARPSWTALPPRGFQNDFVVGVGEAGTLTQARAQAVANGLGMLANRSLDLRTSLRQQKCITDERFSLAPVERGSLSRRCVILEEMIASGRTVSARGLEIAAEHAEEDTQGVVRASVLLRLPKESGIRSPPSRVGLVVRSVLIPGWGQQAKNEPDKARTYLSGVLFFGAVAAGSRVMELEYASEASTAIEQSRRDLYVNRASAFRLGGWGTAALAAAYWGTSIVDATASPANLFVRAPERPGAGWQVGLSVVAP
jgi:hypothetical protein